VNAICFLLENETTQGAYNLTAPEPVMNLDLGHAIAKVFKRPYWMPAPGFALKLALGEMSTLILDGQRVLPKRLMDAGYQFNYPQIDGALRNLLKGSELL
jgi:NAD dependent epimerase/dehydratase family enzyme